MMIDDMKTTEYFLFKLIELLIPMLLCFKVEMHHTPSLVTWANPRFGKVMINWARFTPLPE